MEMYSPPKGTSSISLLLYANSPFDYSGPLIFDHYRKGVSVDKSSPSSLSLPQLKTSLAPDYQVLFERFR